MSEAPPSTKRKRVGPDPSEVVLNPDSPPTRSKIWMPYGDIILQAESTQFRLNRDVLSRQSSVFRDMFSIPQPPNEPTIEGCPIVHVSDTAKDWELFLGMLYDPFQCGDALSSDLVAALLRLGRKYEMENSKKNALWRIHYEFPTTLESWTEVEVGTTKIESQRGFLVKSLVLAYENGIFTSIPTIGFCCLRDRQLEEILTDELWSHDGTPVILPDHLKLILAVAAERIANFQRDLYEWLEEDAVIPDDTCTTNAECIKERNVLRRILNFGDNSRRYHSLSSWDSPCEGEDWSDGLCEPCALAGRTAFDLNRVQFWEALPGFFGLAPWAELKDLD
ncbi:hypothetical protein B0H16DRAFT_1426003 [Mycena metata]|uniref:BTB domain-containing protein n=1 Tax=Mycena metata TaxID=1033252 RepID=A0AAD7MY04_9AGAR|nr:hypothetical protein B0H16DRAFT_1426003 [Mycena metata]